MDEIAQNVGNETDPKLENLLNLSLDTSPEERSRSSELETGCNAGRIAEIRGFKDRV